MEPSYRFYPWVRRGLSGALPPSAPGSQPPPRALANFKVTITPEIVAERQVALLGPGDVIGIDTRLIVRTDPRPGTSDFEPNYMASIELDAPELPWLFTPEGPRPDGSLRPWIVLVVLDRDRVAPPRVARNRPLPFIVAPVNELPDLADSWAWAHVQRLVPSGDARPDAQALLASPDLNVSRLVAVRRLAPDRRWMGCLVPAFDAGVSAGLGIPRPDPAASLQPAWSSGQSDAELPVYYHWDFDTGKTGDFEYLASRLTPVFATPGTGTDAGRRGRVFLGAADGRAETLEAMPPESPHSYVRPDAPLDMIRQPVPTAAEAPRAFADAIVRATTPTSQSANELLPPLYGDRHARRFVVQADRRETHWLDELNLDPRTRLAARLGGDAVRSFQEDLMQAAWTQIGDVIGANAQLMRSRFMAVVAERALERHVDRLPAARILALTSPLHARVRPDIFTVRAVIARTSLPDRTFEPALRRLVSPVGRLSRAVARQVAAADRVVARQRLALGIAEALQRREAVVDPSRVPRDGIGGLELGRRAAAEGPASPSGIWRSRFPWGEVSVSALALSHEVRDTGVSLSPRADLASTGVITERHMLAVHSVADATGADSNVVLEQVVAATRSSPDAARLAVRSDGAAGVPRVVAIDIRDGWSIAMTDPATSERRRLFKVRGLDPATPGVLDAVLRRAPARALADGRHRAAAVRNVGGQFAVSYELREYRFKLPASGLWWLIVLLLNYLFPKRVTHVSENQVLGPNELLFRDLLPVPVRDAQAVGAMTSALEKAAAAAPPEQPTPAFVRADLGGGAGTLAGGVRRAIAPADVFRRRAVSMVNPPAWLRDPSADVLDPIMPAPVLTVPLSELLARAAPERFMPPDLELPGESITALSTNPRFISACLVGANHEMNRELLWRTYPTDGRGTPITRFWNWYDPARRDIAAIHTWPEAGTLASRTSDNGATVVLVVRGRLLRRYPNTLVLAWKAAARGRLAPVPTDPADRRTVLREPVFRIWVEPDVGIVGLDLSEDELIPNPDSGGYAEPGWYIVLQEPITEPRFGLDEPDTPADRRHSRNNLAWPPYGSLPAGVYLAPNAAFLGGVTNSAEMANRLLQRPVRVAFHGTQLVAAFKPEEE